MIDKQIRYELTDYLNMLKNFIHDSYTNNEIDNKTRISLLEKLGSMKSILYSDLEFKQNYCASPYTSKSFKENRLKLFG